MYSNTICFVLNKVRLLSNLKFIKTQYFLEDCVSVTVWSWNNKLVVHIKTHKLSLVFSKILYNFCCTKFLGNCRQMF